ncbi:uncharacterized protein LOC141854776 isoform X2 [Brevipalpus obovatus]|uniref:uncharacterized protein LOC141854776 isoform X2 n=1 Tax=Brevipalpus obovatus TaxID=246614 RepID=UPI003D9DD9BA
MKYPYPWALLFVCLTFFIRSHADPQLISPNPYITTPDSRATLITPQNVDTKANFDQNPPGVPNFNQYNPSFGQPVSPSPYGGQYAGQYPPQKQEEQSRRRRILPFLLPFLFRRNSDGSSPSKNRRSLLRPWTWFNRNQPSYSKPSSRSLFRPSTWFRPRRQNEHQPYSMNNPSYSEPKRSRRWLAPLMLPFLGRNRNNRNNSQDNGKSGRSLLKPWTWFRRNRAPKPYSSQDPMYQQNMSPRSGSEEGSKNRRRRWLAPLLLPFMRRSKNNGNSNGKRSLFKPWTWFSSPKPRSQMNIDPSMSMNPSYSGYPPGYPSQNIDSKKRRRRWLAPLMLPFMIRRSQKDPQSNSGRKWYKPWTWRNKNKQNIRSQDMMMDPSISMGMKEPQKQKRYRRYLPLLLPFLFRNRNKDKSQIRAATGADKLPLSMPSEQQQKSPEKKKSRLRRWLMLIPLVMHMRKHLKKDETKVREGLEYDPSYSSSQSIPKPEKRRRRWLGMIPLLGSHINRNKSQLRGLEDLDPSASAVLPNGQKAPEQKRRRFPKWLAMIPLLGSHLNRNKSKTRGLQDMDPSASAVLPNGEKAPEQKKKRFSKWLAMIPLIGSHLNRNKSKPRGLDGMDPSASAILPNGQKAPEQKKNRSRRWLAMIPLLGSHLNRNKPTPRGLEGMDPSASAILPNGQKAPESKKRHPRWMSMLPLLARHRKNGSQSRTGQDYDSPMSASAPNQQKPGEKKKNRLAMLLPFLMHRKRSQSEYDPNKRSKRSLIRPWTWFNSRSRSLDYSSSEVQKSESHRHVKKMVRGMRNHFRRTRVSTEYDQSMSLPKSRNWMSRMMGRSDSSTEKKSSRWRGLFRAGLGLGLGYRIGKRFLGRNEGYGKPKVSIWKRLIYGIRGKKPEESASLPAMMRPQLPIPGISPEKVDMSGIIKNPENNGQQSNIVVEVQPYYIDKNDNKGTQFNVGKDHGHTVIDVKLDPTLSPSAQKNELLEIIKTTAPVVVPALAPAIMSSSIGKLGNDPESKKTIVTETIILPGGEKKVITEKIIKTGDGDEESKKTVVTETIIDPSGSSKVISQQTMEAKKDSDEEESKSISKQVLPNGDEKTVVSTISKDSDGDVESKKMIIEKIVLPDGGEKVITKVVKTEDKNGDGKPEDIKVTETIKNIPGPMSPYDPASSSASPLSRDPTSSSALPLSRDPASSSPSPLSRDPTSSSALPLSRDPASSSPSPLSRDPASSSALPVYKEPPTEAYQFSPGESSSWLTRTIDDHKNQGKPIDWEWMYKYYKNTASPQWWQSKGIDTNTGRYTERSMTEGSEMPQEAYEYSPGGSSTWLNNKISDMERSGKPMDWAWMYKYYKNAASPEWWRSKGIDTNSGKYSWTMKPVEIPQEAYQYSPGGSSTWLNNQISGMERSGQPMNWAWMYKYYKNAASPEWWRSRGIDTNTGQYSSSSPQMIEQMPQEAYQFSPDGSSTWLNNKISDMERSGKPMDWAWMYKYYKNAASPEWWRSKGIDTNTGQYSSSSPQMTEQMPQEAYQFSPDGSSTWLNNKISSMENSGQPVDWAWMYKYYKNAASPEWWRSRGIDTNTGGWRWVQQKQTIPQAAYSYQPNGASGWLLRTIDRAGKQGNVDWEWMYKNYRDTASPAWWQSKGIDTSTGRWSRYGQNNVESIPSEAYQYAPGQASGWLLKYIQKMKQQNNGQLDWAWLYKNYRQTASPEWWKMQGINLDYTYAYGSQDIPMSGYRYSKGGSSSWFRSLLNRMKSAGQSIDWNNMYKNYKYTASPEYWQSHGVETSDYDLSKSPAYGTFDPDSYKDIDDESMSQPLVEAVKAPTAATQPLVESLRKPSKQGDDYGDDYDQDYDEFGNKRSGSNSQPRELEMQESETQRQSGPSWLRRASSALATSYRQRQQGS